MNLLLTGATGFLGYRTLEKLADADFVEGIVATGRTLVPGRTVRHPKVRYQLGDLSDAAFVDRLVAGGVEAIVHVAALSSPWGRAAVFEQANVWPQRHLIAAARRHGVGRFVFISSPSVYFNGQHRLGVREADPLPRVFANEYARTKRVAEVLLEESGLDYVTLRPRALVGRGDTVIMPRLIRAQQAGRLRVIGDGHTLADLTPVANVADAICCALRAEGEALCQVYNISNGAPVRLWEAIDDVLTALGHRLDKRRAPYWLVRTLAQTAEWKARVTDFAEPTLTVYGVGTLARSMTLDITKAQALLGYRPAMSTADAIGEFVEWYRHENS